MSEKWSAERLIQQSLHLAVRWEESLLDAAKGEYDLLDPKDTIGEETIKYCNDFIVACDKYYMRRWGEKVPRI